MIFVVGNSRSGTTMMARILGRHSHVYTFPELHVFERFVTSASLMAGMATQDAKKLVGRVLSTLEYGFFHQHDLSEFCAEAEVVIGKAGFISAGSHDPTHVFRAALLYGARKYGKEIPCEQTPRNVFYLEEILAAYPDAHVIYMVRDPRDVLLSQKNKWRRRFLGARNIPFHEAFRAWMNYHPFTISKLWCSNERVAKRFAHDSRVVQVRYEDLLIDPEGQIRKICAAIGLGYEPDMLNVPVVGSSLGKDEPERKGVDASRTGNWRRGGLSAEEIAICQFVAHDEMRNRDYPVLSVHASWLRLAWVWLIWPLKTILAILLNLGRTRNMVDSIRRRLFA